MLLVLKVRPSPAGPLCLASLTLFDCSNIEQGVVGYNFKQPTALSQVMAELYTQAVSRHGTMLQHAARRG